MNNTRHSLTLPLAFRALTLLALIIVAEFVNGTVHTLAVALLVGGFTARQVGTVTGCMLIGLVVWWSGGLVVWWSGGLVWQSLAQGRWPARPVGCRRAVADADDGL